MGSGRYIMRSASQTIIIVTCLVMKVLCISASVWPRHLAPVQHNNSPSSQSIVIEWRLGWAEIIWGHGGTSCPCPPTFISGVLYTSSLSRYYRMFCLICIYIIVSIYLLIRSCYAGGNHVVNASTISTTNIKSHWYRSVYIYISTYLVSRW